PAGDDQHVGRMGLVQSQKFCFGQLERGRRAAAVLAHIVGLVARAVAAIERGVEAGTDAAAAGEKPMLHAVEVGKRFGLDHVVSEGVSEKPTGAALLLSPTAKTRNRVPIWPGSIKRASAASMALRPAASARAFKV